MFSHNYKANMLRSVAIFFGFSEGFAVVTGCTAFTEKEEHTLTSF